jgi:hypothetical protein
VIFGESYLGYLSLMLALPFLVFAMFRAFSAAAVGAGVGAGLCRHPDSACCSARASCSTSSGRRAAFGDPAALVLFLTGCIALLGRADTGPRDRFARRSAPAWHVAAALFVRPNSRRRPEFCSGAPAGGAVAAQFRRLAGMCLGFLPVLGMALHNWVYGGVLVLFTSTTGLAMSMPPSAYLAALAELLAVRFCGRAVWRGRSGRSATGLAGPAESVVMAPLKSRRRLSSWCGSPCGGAPIPGCA